MNSIAKISGLFLLILSINLFNSCKKEKPAPPVVTTIEATEISYTTAVSGGNITSEGGAAVIERGICWNTNGDPTIINSKKTETGTIGLFSSNLTQLYPNTKYYLRAFATNAGGTAYGDQVTFTTVAISGPVLTTTSISSITQTTAVTGGNITDDNGGSISARGVCWSTSTDPTTADSKTTDGTGTGAFTSSITGLTANTTYYVKAYSTNSVATSYGEVISFTTEDNEKVTDIDGNIYNTITIGTQVWTTENLKTTKYSNGDIISTTNPADQYIGSENSPKYQWAYTGDENNASIYGRLYTWYVVTDSRNVCPSGWHVPSDAEYTTLTDWLSNNGYSFPERAPNAIGKAMASTNNWQASTFESTVGNNPASNNSSGFEGLPAGRRAPFNFEYLGSSCGWWTTTLMGSSPFDASYAWSIGLSSNANSVVKLGTSKNYGFSVRCLKN